MQSNSSWVIDVCVDLDKKECGTVRARTNQPENGIALSAQEEQGAHSPSEYDSNKDICSHYFGIQ